MAKVGRKANDYITTAGDRIPGLIKQLDGRWRILATGKRFTADSEAEAIARFHQFQGRDTVNVPTEANIEVDERGGIWMKPTTHGEAFWPWLREFIVTNLPTIAQKTGLPGLNGLDLHAIPGQAIKLLDIADLYYDKSSSKQNTRGHVKSAVTKLASITGATTLAELTTPLLIKFRDEIAGDLQPTGAAAIFGKVKSALAFARKEGWDASQIDAALGRMKVLYVNGGSGESKPTPITPKDFRELLTAAPDVQWRTIFLVSLNMAMYLEDCAAMQWADMDLDAGTYVGLRGKTKIRRVGMLWPETVEALRAIARTQSPYVLVSRTGTRYRSDSLHRRYAIIRDDNTKTTATFSSIRDGAYTIAARACDDRTARMFAAHSAPGLMDAYVARNPQLVKPAADAVYAAYAPFPAAA